MDEGPECPSSLHLYVLVHTSISVYKGFAGKYCPTPIVPPANTNLEAKNYVAGKPIDIGASLNLGCKGGMKFVNDFESTATSSTCLPENQWTALDPVEDACVESNVFILPNSQGASIEISIYV